MENRSERVIIIVDMINLFAHVEGSNFISTTQDIIPYVQGELQYFRERMRSVVFCNTIQPECSPYSLEVIQALRPRTGEYIVQKSRPNAFFNTNLAHILQSLKAKNLTIVGAFSATSILTTAASALDLGFSVVVPETCVCDTSSQDHAAALRLILKWLK